jgi:hypothetical protein
MLRKVVGLRWSSAAAGLLAVLSVLVSGLVLMAPAASAAAPIVIDDFSGNTAGPRTVTLEPTANSTTTQATFSQANGLGTMKIFGNGNTAGAVQFDYDLPHLDLTSQGNNTQFFLVFSSINRSDAQPGDPAANISITLTGGGITGTYGTSITNTGAFNIVLNFSCTSNPVCFTPQPVFTDVTHVSVMVAYPQNDDPNGTLTAVIDSINTTPTGGAVPPPATPTITGPTSPDYAPAGSTLQFPVHFSSDGNPATVYSAKTAGNLGPGDVTVGGTAGGVSKVAVSGSAADYTISVGPLTSSGTVVVSMAAGAAVDTWAQPALASNVVTVDYEIPVPPAFTGPAPPDATVGQSYSYQFQAGGIPAATYSFTTGSLPGGLSMDSSGLVTGTPAAGTGGVYSLTVQASNIAASVSEPVQLTVNEAPAFTSTAPPAAVAGTAYSFTFTASGFPAPTFSIAGTLPSGLSLDSSTGVLSGTPAAGTGGTYSLVVHATNTTSTADQSVILDVNEAPAFTSADQATFQVGVSGTFTIQTSGFATPAITESGTLPTGLTFTDNGDGTATIAGSPAAGTQGITNVTLTATNQTSSAQQSLTIQTDLTPTVTSLAPPAAVAGTAYSFTFTADGFPAPTFNIAGTLPSGLSLDSSTGVLSGTPAAGTGGTYSLVVTAANSVGTATQNVVLSVNEAPAFTGPPPPDATVGQTYSYQFQAGGVPGATYSFTSGSLPSGLTMGSPGLVTGTPAAGTGGVYPLTVQAANLVGSVTESVQLTVDEAPAITSPPSAVFVVGTVGTFTIQTTGVPVSSLSESGAMPSGLTFTDNHDGTATISGTPAAGSAGAYQLVITARVPQLPDATQTLTLKAKEAPAFTSPSSAGFTVGVKGTFTVTASGFPTPSFTLTGTLPAGLAFADKGNGTATISGTPVAGTAGSYTVTVNVTNDMADPAQSLTVTILPAASPPSSGAPAANLPAAGSTQLTSNPVASAAPVETGTGSSDAALPSTGINAEVLLATALALVSLGVLLVAAVRTRRYRLWR